MTDTVDLKQQQLAAIEASGWGERFRLVQPRNPVFWIYAWAVVVGVIHLIDFYQPGLGNYGGALAAGTVGFAIYAIPWIAFLHWLDRYTSVQPKLLATGFVWGAVVASTFIALTLNTAVLTLYEKGFGQAWAADWSAGGTAPLTEESAKALGFVVLLGLAPRLIRSAFDAFIIGAFIGLGFQIAENILYAYQGSQSGFGTDQPAQVIQTVVLRGATGIVSHTLFSALVCTGLAWIIGTVASGRHVLRGLLCIVFAMFAHFVWDDASALGDRLFGDAGLVVLPLIAIIAIIVVLKVAKLASANERLWVGQVLGPEVADGHVSAAEAEAAAGTRRGERKYVKGIDGHHDRKTARHVLDGVHQLAAAIGHARGEDTPDVIAAREEVARLRAG